MPSLATLQAFAAAVNPTTMSAPSPNSTRRTRKPGKTTMQRSSAATCWRKRSAARWRRWTGVETTRLGPLFLDGDHSAICWRFEFTRTNGTKWAMEEMALQTWRGEQVAEERFFYDPKQLPR